MNGLHIAARARDFRPSRQYAVVITRGASTWYATVPDLPGCAAVCRTRPEVEHQIQRAVLNHVAALEERGLPVPEPRSSVVLVATR